MELAAILAPFLPAAGLTELQLEQVRAYLNLLLKWNQKTNLTSVRQPEEIVRRHFGESFFLAAALAQAKPQQARKGDPAATFMDIGSGAGFPGVPLKIYTPQLSGTLIESQNKKATFLKEVIRALKLAAIEIFSGRAEHLLRAREGQAGIVTLRAVEHFEKALPLAARFVAPGGHLVLLVGAAQLDAAHRLVPSFGWEPPRPLPLSDSRVLVIGMRKGTESGTLGPED